MKYCINIKTPSPDDSDGKAKLKEFVDAYKDAITVNGLYRTVLEEPLNRPNFNFLFWFDDEELATKFCDEFDGCWYLDKNDKPKKGWRTTEENGFYYCPMYPKFVDLSNHFKFRRETQNGTQVRNAVDEEWQFAWDL